MSEKAMRDLGNVIEGLLDGVLLCAVIIIVLKIMLYIFREGKIAWLIQIFRIIRIIFFASYFMLVGLFLFYVLFTSQSVEEMSWNLLVSIVILFLGFMFWIGPINGILGMKFRKKSDYVELGEKKVSKDGWIIESWTGQKHGEIPNKKEKTSDF